MGVNGLLSYSQYLISSDSSKVEPCYWRERQTSRVIVSLHNFTILLESLLTIYYDIFNDL